VADAAVATNTVGDGRFIPLVILDTTVRPDIAELIAIHEKVPPGDVVSAWGEIIGGPKDHLALFMHFKRPMELDMAINFDLRHQGSIVELALRTRAIYLQAGKPGDRLLYTFESSRMIAELRGEMPAKLWEDLWRIAIKNRLRSDGLRNGEAKKKASQYIEQMRERFQSRSTFESEIYIDPTAGPSNDTAAAPGDPPVG
jgi:hypothetical protein